MPSEITKISDIIDPEVMADMISYASIVDAIDLFTEEVNSEKVMFIHPNQVSKLRKDNDFISADKYTDGVMLTGEIGRIANARIVPSKRVPLHAAWYKFDDGGTAATTENIAEVQETLPNAKVGDKVTKVTTPAYFCLIFKLTADSETEDETAALTIYLKCDTNVETDREALKRTTVICADKLYAAALSDQSKAVLAKIKK